MCVYFCVSTFLYHSHWQTNLRSFLFSSQRCWTSSPRTWRSQDRNEFTSLLQGCRKFQKALALYNGIHAPPITIPCSYPAKPLDFHAYNSKSDHQVVSFTIFYRLFFPKENSTIFINRNIFLLKANYEKNKYWIIKTLYKNSYVNKNTERMYI